MILSKRCCALCALTRLTEAIAPELTRGLTATPLTTWVASSELNFMPVGSTPILSRITSALPRSCITSAAVNGFETDWMENA